MKSKKPRHLSPTVALHVAALICVSCVCAEDPKLFEPFTNSNVGPLGNSLGENRPVTLPIGGADAEIVTDDAGKRVRYTCTGPGSGAERVLEFEFTQPLVGDVAYVSWKGTATGFNSATVLRAVIVNGDDELAGYEISGAGGDRVTVRDLGNGPLSTARGDASNQPGSHVPAIGYNFGTPAETLGAFGGFVGNLVPASEHGDRRVGLRFYFNSGCQGEAYEIDDVKITECCPKSAGEMCRLGQD